MDSRNYNLAKRRMFKIYGIGLMFRAYSDVKYSGQVFLYSRKVALKQGNSDK